MVFIELLMPIVIAVDRRHGWPVPTFLVGRDLDFSLLSMYAGCGGQAEVVHGACPGLLWLFWQGRVNWLQAVSGQWLDLPTVQWLQLWLPWSQSRVTSINIEIHQPSPTRDFRTWRGFFLLGMGQFIGGQCSFSGENHYNVKLQTSEGKNERRLVTVLLQIPLYRCQTSFLPIIAQKEPKGWWGMGVGWILEQSRWCLLP